LKYKLPRGAGFRNIQQVKTQIKKGGEKMEENNMAINIMPTID